MKILLLTCVVASVFAAPAEKTKRNILPGDSRYNPHDHHHDDVHHHHQNEIETIQALGDFTGFSSTPTTDYGVPGLKPGTPLRSDDFQSLKREFDSNVNKLANKKIDTDSVTVTESSFPWVKSESSSSKELITDIASSRISESDDKLITSSEKTEVDSASTSGAVSSDYSTTTASSNIIAETSTSKPFSIDADSVLESSTSSFQPGFDSSFGSTFGSVYGAPLDRSLYSPFVETIPLGATGFTTFDQTNYNPEILSSYNFYNDADKKIASTIEDGKVEVKSSDGKDTSKTTFESTTVKADSGSTFAPEFKSRISPSLEQPFDASFYSSSFGAVPFNTEGFTSFNGAAYVPSTFSNFGSYYGAGKELSKSVDDAKFEVKSVSNGPIQDDVKTTIESTTVKVETSDKEVSSGVTGSKTTPIKSELRSSFGSEYNSGFPSSFGQLFDSGLSSSSFGAVPFQTTTFNQFDQTKYNSVPFPSYNFNANSGKEAVKSVESSKVEAKTTDSQKSSGTVKIDKSNQQVSTASFGPTFNSRIGYSVGQPIRSTSVQIVPSISTEFNTFDQVKYNPSIGSSYPYASSFNGFNGNYEQYSPNYGGLNSFPSANTFAGNSFSGLNSYVPPQPIRYQTSYSSPQFVTSAPFSAAASLTQSSPFDLKIGNEGSYLSPSLGQQFSVSTESPLYQQEVFKNYQGPVSFAQSTPAPFYQPQQSEVRISESSFSGISQQTDANGGYIY